MADVADPYTADKMNHPPPQNLGTPGVREDNSGAACPPYLKDIGTMVLPP